MRHSSYIFLSAALLWAGKVAFAQSLPTSPTKQSSSTGIASEILVSSDIGYTLEVHSPNSPSSPNSSNRLVIHIQEAHANYEGQQHLAAMLVQLIKQQKIKLILVEGGAGDVSLSYLRQYGPAQRRKQLADEYLRLGLISGEEYVDLTTQEDIRLWGVEDPELYRMNVRLFMEVSALQPSLRRTLRSVHQAIEALKPKVYPPPLIALEATAERFANQQVSLSDYAQTFLDRAQAAQLALEEFPDLQALGRSAELSRSVHREAIPQEQTLLMAQLSKQIGTEALDELVDQAKRMRAGTLSRETFYRNLEAQIFKSKLDMEPYHNLAKYLESLRALKNVSPSALSKEMDELTRRLRTVLATTPQSKTLLEIASQLELVDKFVELKLSPEEYRAVERVVSLPFTFRWPVALNEQLRAQGQESRAYEGLDRLSAALPILRQFYQATQARDAVLADNVLKQLDLSHENAAILITGGFHGPEIAKRLSDAHVGVVVMVPRMTQPSSEALYEAVLKYKTGLGSYKEVESAANALIAQAKQP